MQLISAQDGVLRTLPLQRLGGAGGATFSTGLAALDALPPGGGFARGAVHEVLGEPAHGTPRFFALLLARAAAAGGGAVVWSDPRGELYPPAGIGSGLPPDRLFFLQTGSADEVWAVAECLRCKGVAATVAAPPRLSRVEARRLQLAAESGGGVGILLRPAGAPSAHYAAATRWLVRPDRGGEAVQRWSVQLAHGHGGQVGRAVRLEVCRDTNHVRAVNVLADRPGQAQAPRASA